MPSPSTVDARRAIIGRDERWSLLLLASFIFVMVCGVLGRLIGYLAADIAPVFLVAVWLWVAGLLIERFGATGLGQCCRLVAVFGAAAVATAWASDVLAVVSLPYADDRLARADALFGFHWLSMIAAVRSHTQALVALSYAYVSLTWQPVILIVALCAARRSEQAWRFVAAWSIALACCLVVFPFCPAVGGFVHYHIPREAVPGVLCPSAWQYSLLTDSLRSGAVTVMSNATLEGMIAMPSFHAAAAVLLGWRAQALPWLRWPFLLLNVAMLASAIPIGGHYLVDVLAGVAVALGAIAATSRSPSGLKARLRAAVTTFRWASARPLPALDLN